MHPKDNKTSKKAPEEELEKHVRLIHVLAKRLPWIVVAVSLLAMLYFIIEAYLRKGA